MPVVRLRLNPQPVTEAVWHVKTYTPQGWPA